MKAKLFAILAALGLMVVAVPATANAGFCYPWWCPNPPPPPTPPTLFAEDHFDGDTLGPDWLTKGGGTLYVDGNHQLSGVGTPSVPMSYIYRSQPVPSDTQIVKATIHYNGRNPAHSAIGVTVRADPSRMPAGSTGPAGASGATFWLVNTQMGIMYEDPAASGGFRPASGTPTYAQMAMPPDGSQIEVDAVGSTYTAFINGKQVLSGTISTLVIPTSQHYAGAMIQDDSQVANGGQPPANLDDLELLYR